LIITLGFQKNANFLAEATGVNPTTYDFTITTPASL
jgi:hypothetical protein